MSDYRRSNKKARSVFSSANLVGGITFALGIIFSVSAMSGIGDSFGRYTPTGAYLLAALPGVGVALLGFLIVVLAQIGSTMVDSAEIAVEMLRIAKGESAM